MAADDVTDTSKPLSGGRARSNFIYTHRIELGLPERKFVKDYLAANATADVMKGVGAMVAPFGNALGVIVGAIVAKEGVEALLGWMVDGLGSRQKAIDDDYEAYLAAYWSARNATDAEGNLLNPNASGQPMNKKQYEKKFGHNYLNNAQRWIAYPVLDLFGYGDEFARWV